MPKKPENNIIIFKTDDEKISVDVRFYEETVWLTLDQMAALFEKNKSTVSRHIKNIFDEMELHRDSVVANFATTATDGKIYKVDYYNLDVIISVGYRGQRYLCPSFSLTQQKQRRNNPLWFYPMLTM
jgi:hypothetical protein